MKINYPKALKPGDKIGITAPSSGVQPEHFERLELVFKYLQNNGFEVVEGKCLRESCKHVSAPRIDRANEFKEFWRDPGIKAIMPPWGGEILVEILPLIDFAELKTLEPKWLSGYSDVSTLLLPLTVCSQVATVHGANLMDLSPSQTDHLTTSLIDILQLSEGEEFKQKSSKKYQAKWLDIKTHPEAPLNLTEPTQWKLLNNTGEDRIKFGGRLIGGCLDTIARLVGTPYANLPSFYREASSDGVIFYFENCEMSPCELTRTLWNIRLAGWLNNISGILIGRSAGPDASSEDNLSYVETLEGVLGDLDIPIIYEVDIGHRPPQFNIINGSVGCVEYESGHGELTLKLI